MKTIRAVLDKQIGFFSFLLAFVIFYSGSVRGLLTTDLTSPRVIHVTSSPKNQSDLQQQQATIFNAVGQIKTLESEVDEVHFDFIFPKPVVFTFISVENQLFNQVLDRTGGSKLPLYDLYCNWKIHLF